MESPLPPPLASVTLAMRASPAVGCLAHVTRLVSLFLDRSADIPLSRACATGSLALLNRIWLCSHSPVEQRVWCPAPFLQSDRHYRRWAFSRALVEAVRRRDLAVVEWLFAHFSGCVSPVEVVEEAAATGQLNILQLLLANDSGLMQGQYGLATSVGDSDDEDGHAMGRRNGVTWGGKDVYLAAKNGHSDVVRWLFEHAGSVERVRDGVVKYAVRSGDLPLVQWLVGHVFQERLSPFLADDAAREGHLPMLQWLVDQLFNDCEYKVRVPGGNLEVIKWLADSSVGTHVEGAFPTACGQGPLPVVWWLADYITAKGITLDSHTAKNALQLAAANGRLEVVQWLVERNIGVGSKFAASIAASNGHLEVAKHLHARGLTGFSLMTMEDAARNGFLDVVKWLWAEFGDDPEVDILGMRRNGILGSPFATAMVWAATNGHLEVMQFLHSVASSLAGKERKCGGRDTNAPAQPGHEGVHAIPGRNVYPTTINMQNAVSGAAGSGHLHVVQWLCVYTSVGNTTSAMDEAASGGHLDVVRWLHENRSDGCTTRAMDAAAGCGHLPVVEWLHTHRSEGHTTNALEGASYGGHLRVAQWLISHPLKGFTSKALKLAISEGHFEVVLLLHWVRGEWRNEEIVREVDGNGDPHIAAWLQENLGNALGSDGASS